MTSLTTPGLLDAMLDRTILPRGDCLIWTGACERGYGRLEIEGVWKKAHRVVWHLTNGPIPDDMTIDHLCRVRACINTDHMELITHSENASRGNRSRVVGQLGDECARGHRGSYRVRPNGKRRCRECERQRSRERRERATSTVAA